MAVRKRDESKVVAKLAAGTYLDVRVVLKHEGMGKQRKIKSQAYGIFHTKTRVLKDDFKTKDLAIAYIAENIGKYDKKHKNFRV